MRILFILSLFITISQITNGQDPYRGLISSNYIEITSDRQTLIKQPLLIIYNRFNCSLSIGKHHVEFPVIQYEQSIDHGNLTESFLNEETNDMQNGDYSIRINHNKSGSSTVLINSRTGVGYYTDQTRNYSENGRITGKVYINNWKELEESNKKNNQEIELKRKIEDSIRIARDKNFQVQKKFDDSLKIVQRIKDSLDRINTEIETKKRESYLLTSGEGNSISLPKSIEKYIDSSLNMLVNDKYIIDHVKLFITKDGIIESATNLPNQSRSYDIIPILNKLLKELKVKINPYTDAAGNLYPSYSNMEIIINPDLYQYYKRNLPNGKKRIKQSLF